MRKQNPIAKTAVASVIPLKVRWFDNETWTPSVIDTHARISWVWNLWEEH